MLNFVECSDFADALPRLFVSVQVADDFLEPFLGRISSWVEEFSPNGCFVEAAFWSGRVFLTINFSVETESVFLEIINLQ